MRTEIEQQIDHLYRFERAKVIAAIVRVAADLDLAEDMAQEAFAAALKQWPLEGIPAKPTAWLISTGRFKAIDAIRRRERLTTLSPETMSEPDDISDEEIADDTLRLILMCCHPSLPNEGQIALTLREVCGLTTEEIAKAFLCPGPTIAQRIVRAKAKLREVQQPFDLPASEDLNARLANVLRVAYLVFNEGYYASSGYSLTKTSLSNEAIRLARLLVDLRPDAEAIGLLALMLLTDSRRDTRMDSSGNVILFADQDRTKWHQSLIAEGIQLSIQAGCQGIFGIQAAILAVHAQSPTVEATNWDRIIRLYDLLLVITNSPVVELNRAVAVSMCNGPSAGLAIVEAIFARGQLMQYGLAYSVQADFLRKLNRTEEAISALNHALSLSELEPEKRLLQKRISDWKSS